MEVANREKQSKKPFYQYAETLFAWEKA